MPDLIYKSKLYVTVVANQIHICNKKCKGPAPSEQTCKKGFSRPYKENDKNPHYDDNIMKYMARPHLSEFNNLTYPQYFERYSIILTQPAHTLHQIYYDRLGNYVLKCSKEIVTRYQFLKIEDGKPYFYQQLLLRIPARNESNYKITSNSTYYEKLLLSLSQQLPLNLSHIIQLQMEDLKLLFHIFSETANSTIRMYLEKNDVPTGIAAQNIGSKTIYSELKIVNTQRGFNTYAYTDNELKSRLKKINTIIIEEISMVSAELLDFISNIFANLHNNAIAFCGINVIIVSNLILLSPISDQQVF
ncbi:AAA family ATPase [Rhizophagus clarus]|uniref:ATP-dependent DNA helicase n=1 Tax=Rhizophagus clarus TaxID=94130 RepID=A0A8H3QXL6_9GLOM|nr:AAA family ATPase [Rhizophagus clarus]